MTFGSDSGSGSINISGQGGLALPLFSFYLIVFCNFIPEIVGCRLQNLLRNDMLAKHLLSFVLLLMLVVISTPNIARRNLPIVLASACLIYAWFFATTRCPLSITLLVLFLLMAAYISDQICSSEKTEEFWNKAVAAKTRDVCAIVAFALSMLGFALYFVEKRVEFGDAFSLKTFLLGTATCGQTLKP
jgi:hypothetical protein